MSKFERHNDEIQKNISFWEQKPVLQKIYNDFYSIIVSCVSPVDGKIVELGSGIGNLKSHLPQCICTDVFDNPWIDQVENAYQLSFENDSVSNLILFDVWHHLEYPALALNEFDRVLKRKGRVIIFEPFISWLGFIVYGLFHPEPVGIMKPINMQKDDVQLQQLRYYAAQGNATRFFLNRKYQKHLLNFSTILQQKIPAIAYVMSGGYSKKQLFPDDKYTFFKKVETFVQKMPWLFATRLLIVLEKK